jgi:OOP family OmpA-OmpF porin
MNLKSILAALALVALSGPAFSQARWYAGVSVGQSDTDEALVRNRESTVVNANVVGSDFDSRDTAFKLFAGYRVLPWLAVELNYADLGRSTLTTNIVTTGNPASAGSVVLRRNISGFGADAVVTAPLGRYASVFGRVGAVQGRIEADATLTGAIVFTNGGGGDSDRHRSVVQSETLTRFGAGAEWMLDPRTGLRIEWERWLDVGKAFAIGGSGTTGEADMDVWMVGLAYRF